MKLRVRTERNSCCGAVLRRVCVPGLCLVAVLWCFAGHADITYTDFPDAGGGAVAGMTFNGNQSGLPTSVGNRLRLTLNGTGSTSSSTWYDTKQYVGDVWETTFTFEFTNNDGDGFAFVIQNSPDGTAALGDGGGGKGYAGITNCVAIEFDSYTTEDISVHSNGTAANRHDAESLIATTSFTPDDEEHEVKIEHSADGGLEIFLDDMVTPVLTCDSRLDEIGWDGGAAYVGFTAGTGAANQTCEIIDWSFTDTDTLPPTNPGLGSPTHVFPSAETTMVIRWGGAEDFGSGVDGYSYVFDSNPPTTPDATVDLGHTTDPHELTYDSLVEGTYYFHLRTHDNADRWSDTKHIGPLVVDSEAPPLPVAGPVVIGLAAAAVVLAGARVVRRRRA